MAEMNIEELDFEVKTYNRLKKAGINTVDELLAEMYSPGSKVSQPDAKRCEAALKEAGIIRYMRGDIVTEDDVEPEPLTWDDLHSCIGRLVVHDCSTESHRWLKVCWIYDIQDDGEGNLIYIDGSSSYGYARRSSVNGDFARDFSPFLKYEGRFFALKESELLQAQQSHVIVESAEYTRAVSLHRKICVSAELAEQNLFEMCKGLCEMRDSKLYREFGYQNFEEYCTTELKITRRQGQKYAAIASLLTIENGKSTSHFEKIGTEKLYLLSRIEEDARVEIMNKTDLENTSVRELKEKIGELKKANDRLMGKVEESEQKAAASRKSEEAACGKLSILRTDSEMKDQKIKQLEAKKAELEYQIEELEDRPVEVAVQTNDEEIDKLTAQFKEELAKREKDVERRLEEQKEFYRGQIKALSDNLAKESENAAAECEKEAADAAKLDCMIRFVKDSMNKLAKLIIVLDDTQYARQAVYSIEDCFRMLKKAAEGCRDKEVN